MKPTPSFPLLSLVLLLSAATATARPLERVPEDGDLERALQRVSDGGVIEIAEGVYAPPPGGFEVRSLDKSFTVRPAAGAEVVFDGGETDPLFFISGDGASSGHRIAFERLAFQNGLSADASRGGAVTVRGADVVFVSSTFQGNAVDTTDGGSGGGAVRAVEDARVRLVNCLLEDNSAGLRGGAIFAVDSEVAVLWSELRANRTNLPGHSTISAGGAILALDSRLEVNGSLFEENEAGWVGGAINGFGTWREPLGDPAAFIRIHNSAFVGNRAQADPCCDASPGPTVGGAIHVEDHTTLEIDDSRFFENVAEQGGAVSTYRGLVTVTDGTFRGNRAVGTGAEIAAGGTFFLTSSDFADPSTEFGAVDRRPASLAVSNSLVEGRFGATGIGARQGGCLFASGDRTRQDGLGVPRNDDPEANRARVVLDEVVFADCDVRTDDGPGRGGAIFTNLAAVEMVDSLVFDSDALGDDATGGAVNGFVESAFTARGSFFADNSAESRGGAVILVGGEVDVSGSVFLRNEVSPGTVGPVQGATGAALDMNPDDERDANVTGVVSDSIFAENDGLPIVDRDSFAPPFNTVRYDDNLFHSTTFGNLVYRNTAVGTGGGLTATQLNGLVVNHAGGVRTDKSEGGNRRQAGVPRTGIVVAGPSEVQDPTANGETPARAGAFLGYAWSGNGATLDGDALADGSGLERTGRPGTFPLRVNGQATGSATVGGSDCSDGTLLCVNRDRFLLEVAWRDFVGNTGYGEVVPFADADDSGLYFFFEPDNWEMLVKVLNGCGITQHFWGFAAATTNVEYTLRVTDTESGATKTYFNPLGNASPAITDTSALAVCDGLGTPPPEPEAVWAELEEAVERSDELLGAAPAAKGGTCVPSDTALCLNDERFRLEVAWRDFSGNTGAGETLDFRTDDSGLFFFFSEDNIEMLVKVLDGCGFNGHYWVFSAATTDVEYTLTVTDTQTGDVSTYFNRLGNAAAAVTDTGAFDTCP